MAPAATVLIILIIFGSIPALILGLVHLRNRNKERMAIIEKGADPSILATPCKPSANLTLRGGIFLIGLAIGIITGGLIAEYTYLFANDELAYFASIFFFGGASLLLASYLDKATRKQE